MTDSFRLPPVGIFNAVETAALDQRGMTRRQISGLNEDVDSAAVEDVWPPGGEHPWLITPAPLIARSTDANDTAAGTGARTLIVEGLDANGLIVLDTITMAGTGDSAPTTQAFMRINAVDVATCGTYGGNNLGDIIIETETTAIVQSFILAGSGKQEQTHFTIPSNFQGLIYGITVSVDSTKPADVFIRARTGANIVTAPFPPSQRFFRFGGLAEPVTIPLAVPPPLPPWLDFWFEAIGQGQNAIVQVTYGVILVPI